MNPPVISEGITLIPLFPFSLHLFHFWTLPIQVRSIVTAFTDVAEVDCHQACRCYHGVERVTVVEPNIGVVELPSLVTPSSSENESRSLMSTSLNIPY